MQPAHFLKHLYLKAFKSLRVGFEPSELEHPVVIHISDIPSVHYDFVFHLIEIVSPDFVIHTGDVIDEIKLSSHKNSIHEYTRKCESILGKLSCRSGLELLIIPGNHDDRSVLEGIAANSGNVQVMDPGSLIRIKNKSFYLVHALPEKFPDDCDYVLYGHGFRERNGSASSHRGGNRVLLNGFEAINVISLPSETLHRVEYPSHMNHFRNVRRGFFRGV